MGNLEEIPIGQHVDLEEALRLSAIPFLVEARDRARLPESFQREFKKGHFIFISAEQRGVGAAGRSPAARRGDRGEPDAAGTGIDLSQNRSRSLVELPIEEKRHQLQLASDQTWKRFIPACAGEPCRSSSSPRRKWVYPRVCGGTCLFNLHHHQYQGLLRVCGETSTPAFFSSTITGLSPRVRGNRTICLPSSI